MIILLHEKISCIPEEHKDKMGRFPPSDTDDLQPSVSVRCVKLQLSCELHVTVG